MKLFQSSKRAPTETEEMDLPGIKIIVNYELKLVFIHDNDPAMKDDRWSEVEAHLNAQGFYVLVIGVEGADNPTE